MTSLHTLREFISERLTAAAGEIFTVFERTVLQYEEQIARQQKLLEVTWNPRVKLIRTEIPQQHAANQKTSSSLEQEEHEAPHIKEEFDVMTDTESGSKSSHEPLRDVTTQRLTTAADLQQDGVDEQLFNQKMNDCLDQEKTQPEEIREEQEEPGPVHFKEEQEEPGLVDFNKDQEEPGPFQVEQNQDLGTSQEFCDSFRVPSIEDQSYWSETKPVPDTDLFLSRDSDLPMTAHTGEKPYSTETCGKTFSQHGNMLVHMETHTGERTYGCETCGRRFRDQGCFLRHMKAHTGERPYTCEICGKTFKRQNHLSLHVRSHTGEKPYSCETCGKSFKRQNHLSVHIRVHTGEKPYSCERCGSRFSDYSCFSRHMRSHTGERPYSCETCGKRFKWQNNLLVHIRIHTGEKPYSCKICGQRFAHGNSLLHHMNSHK